MSIKRQFYCELKKTFIIILLFFSTLTNIFKKNIRDKVVNMGKDNEKSDNAVYIGKRPTMNYVMAAMVILNKGTNCVIKARGRRISHAVDVSEILINKFFPGAKYEDIRISTEVLENDDGSKTNVSSMEIEVSPQ